MAQTKAEWRKGKLRFYGAPMFSACANMGAGVSVATGTACKDETVIVSVPVYPGTFTTENTQQFRASIGGIISSSSAACLVTLRYGTADVLACSLGGTKVKSTKVPFHVEFNGRITKTSSSGHIAATAHGYAKWSGGTTEVFYGTTGAAGSSEYATSNLNVVTTSTLGLNVTIDFDTTGKTRWNVNHGVIQLFD